MDCRHRWESESIVSGAEPAHLVHCLHDFHPCFPLWIGILMEVGCAPPFFIFIFIFILFFLHRHHYPAEKPAYHQFSDVYISGMISRNICPYHWVTLFLLPSFPSINCQNSFSDIQKNSGETGNYCSADRLHHIWHAFIWGISIPWSHIQPMHYLFLTSTARIPFMTFKTILQKWQIIFQLKDFTTSSEPVYIISTESHSAIGLSLVTI